MNENDDKGMSKDEFDGLLKNILNVPAVEKDKRDKSFRQAFDLALSQQFMFQSNIAPSKVYLLYGEELTEEDLVKEKIDLVIPEKAECYKGEMHVIANDEIVENKYIIYFIISDGDTLYLQFGKDKPMKLVGHSQKDRSFTFEHPVHGKVIFTQFKRK